MRYLLIVFKDSLSFMNYLIFRTDRIGDFLLTLPLIKTIKDSDSNAKYML